MLKFLLMISIFCSAVKCYGLTETRECELRKLVGKKENQVNVSWWECVFFYISLLMVCNVHSMLCIYCLTGT